MPLLIRDSVVAVHGLGGDSDSTWTKGNTNWIRHLLPRSDYFKEARIFSFGYDSAAFLSPFSKSSNGRTFVFAEALLNDLSDNRGPSVSISLLNDDI